MGRRGAVTLRGLRREVRERRAIWEEHQANYERGTNEASRAVADMCHVRVDELRWVEHLIRDFTARAAANPEREADNAG